MTNKKRFGRFVDINLTGKKEVRSSKFKIPFDNKELANDIFDHAIMIKRKRHRRYAKYTSDYCEPLFIVAYNTIVRCGVKVALLEDLNTGECNLYIHTHGVCSL